MAVLVLVVLAAAVVSRSHFQVGAAHRVRRGMWNECFVPSPRKMGGRRTVSFAVGGSVIISVDGESKDGRGRDEAAGG